jgi:probable rRNA maturation factor
MKSASSVTARESSRLTTEISVRNLSGRAVDLDELYRTAQRCLQAEGAQLAALSVALVDNERISQLNARLLGHEGPTDVISFESEAGEGEGEVILSVEQAELQAAEHGHTPHEELHFLLAHGVLHALGWDDTEPEDRRRMLERQHEILCRTED